MVGGGSFRQSFSAALKTKFTENDEDDEEEVSNVNVQIIRGIGEKFVYSIHIQH